MTASALKQLGLIDLAAGVGDGCEGAEEARFAERHLGHVLQRIESFCGTEYSREEKLREQSPRVVGSWTLPDEVWFDVRTLGVDAKVRLKPCLRSRAVYLFQGPSLPATEPDFVGVLLEVTGAEHISGRGP